MHIHFQVKLNKILLLNQQDRNLLVGLQSYTRFFRYYSNLWR